MMTTIYQAYMYMPCLREWHPCAQTTTSQQSALDAAERAADAGYRAAIVVADIPDPLPGADVPIIYVTRPSK